MTGDESAKVRFGRELHRLRRLSDYTQQRLANEVGGFSSSHISNIERGKSEPSLRLVRDLDRALLAQGRLEKLWGQLTDTREPVWLDELAAVEGRATSIMESQNAFVPALLQTEDYATAVIAATTPGMARPEVEESVKARIARAERFAASNLPAYRAVLDIVAIRRIWGNAVVMAEQLSRIVERIESNRVAIQVVERTRGHPGLAGPFTLITSPSAPDVVYVESADLGQISDDPERVARFRLLFSDVQAAALSPEESLELIRAELEKLTDDY